MVFAGKYPIITKSFKVSSVTVEGTQLQTVGAFDGMMKKGQTEKKVICRFNLLVELLIHDYSTDE